jgi:hypothetical protein
MFSGVLTEANGFYILYKPKITTSVTVPKKMEEFKNSW